MLEIIKWNPLQNSNIQRWFCEGVHDDYEGFRILLKGEGKSPTFRILFETKLLYQNRDESDLFLINDNSVIGRFEFPHPFYILKNSTVTENFNIESGYKYDKINIKHFAIYTCNDCIDVLTKFDPVVKQLN